MIVQTHRVQPSEEIGIGLVGCGWVAQEKHLPALARTPGVRAVALADPDAGALAAAGALAPEATRHTGAAALIADPRVAAVGVLTPPALHADVALAALAAGLPVLVEKPLGPDAGRCAELVSAAASASVTAATGFNLRGHPVALAARGAIARGEIGSVLAVRTLYSDSILGAPRGVPQWRRERRLGGGAGFEKLVHHVDLVRFLTGEEIVSGSAETIAGDADDERVALTLRLERGAIVSALALDQGATANEVEVLGSRGRLALDLYRADGLRLTNLDEVSGNPRARIRRAAGTARQAPAVLASMRGVGAFDVGYDAEWSAFAAAVRGVGQPLASLEDGAAAVAVLERALTEGVTDT